MVTLTLNDAFHALAILFNLSVVVVVPQVSQFSVTIQRALQIYDAQPEARMDAVKAEQKVKEKTSRKAKAKGLCLFMGGLVCYFALVLPLPEHLRSLAAGQIFNRVRFFLLDVLLAVNMYSLVGLVLGPVLQKGFGFNRGTDLMLFRISKDVYKLKPTKGEIKAERVKAAMAALALVVSFSVLPLPQGFFSLQRIDTYPRMSDARSLIVFVSSLVTAGLQLIAQTATTSTFAGSLTTRTSLLKINVVPIAVWLAIVVMVAVITAEIKSADKEHSQSTEEDMPSDGVLETFILCFYPTIYWGTSMFAYTFFGFLYRYEVSQHQAKQQGTAACEIDEASARDAMVPTAGTLPEEVADHQACPVSLEKVFRIPVPLRFMQSKVLKTTFIISLLWQLADSAFMYSIRNLGLPTWTESKTTVPVFSCATCTVIPILSAVALWQTRHNDVSLWRYRENWSLDSPTGEIKLEDESNHGETVASDGKKAEDSLLVKA